MSEQSHAAENIEQRYVSEHAETEDILTGLDPENTDRDAKTEVEAVGDDADGHVERMAGDKE